MKLRTLRRTATALSLAILPLAVTAAPQAQAAGTCVPGGTIGQPGSGGEVIWTKYWCHNRYAAPVYNKTYVTPEDVDYMYSTYSWFICQQQGNANPVTYNSSGSANHNNWWVWTLADTGLGMDRWGYMPATYINEGGNWAPIPGVPSCNDV